MQDRNLYIVVGGELEFIHQQHYRDPEKVEVFGVYEDKEEAMKVWRGISQKNVDNAHYRVRVAKVY